MPKFSAVRPAILIAAAAALACTGGAPLAAKPRPAQLSAAATRGLAFAQAHCTGCHAITANGTSPNPEAPPWDDVANREGLTARTFAAFLADAHNYPAAMDFTVQHGAIRDLSAYMLTLRKPGYRPTR
ncbi:c-type cytochrome [Novosphingobium bradum]|uniref:C-type cytochrome n=1 Tax=Novosphingobium bradum TaxID=1737444 RepID=A0ABV7IRW7_9SPHN